MEKDFIFASTFASGGQAFELQQRHCTAGVPGYGAVSGGLCRKRRWARQPALRSRPLHVAYAAFQAGDAVQLKSDGKWYDAVVDYTSNDGMITAHFSQDDFVYHCRPSIWRVPRSYLTLSKLLVGQRLSGTIVNITGEAVFVDVGAKHPGIVNSRKFSASIAKNFTRQLKCGEQLNVWVLGVTGEDRLELTALDLWGIHASKDQWLKGTVTQVRPYGCLVHVEVPAANAGVDGLLPITDIRQFFVSSAEDLLSVGQQLTVRIIDLDMDNLRVVFSLLPKKDVAAFQNISAADWLRGMVVAVSSSGIYVRLAHPAGGEPQVGFVPASLVRDDPAVKVEDEAKVGQEINVRVHEVDRKLTRLTLSMLPAQDLVWLQDLPPHTWLNGTVQSVHKFGAFVNVNGPDTAGDIRGMVNTGELRPYFVTSTEDEVKVGEQVRVRILDVDDRGHVKLSMKNHTNLTSFVGVSDEHWLQGMVESHYPSGLLVRVQPLQEGEAQLGFVDKDSVRNGFIDRLEDEFPVGQEARVRVVRLANGNMVLSMKPKADWSAFKNISKSYWLTGVVKDVHRQGLMVIVPPPGGGEAQIGLVSPDNVKEGVGADFTKEFRVGQQVKVRALAVNSSLDRLDLTMKEALPGMVAGTGVRDNLPEDF